MRISEDGRRVEYGDYQEYLEHQAMRRNVLSEENPAVFDPHDHPWIVENLEVFYRFVNPESRILDIGCRSGWSCLRMVRDGYNNMLGVDVQPDNIKFGRAWGAPIEQADAHSLPYPDESFDAVFIRHALEHMFDPQQVVNEAHRVLNPGGILFVVIPLEPSRLTEESVTHVHAYCFDRAERLLDLVQKFRIAHFRNSGDELTYAGVKGKSGLNLALWRAKMVGWELSLTDRASRAARRFKRTLWAGGAGG